MYANMRIMKLKEMWSFNDGNLVHPNGLYSDTGLAVFWRSFDNAVNFNSRKREEFLAKSAVFRKRTIPGKNQGYPFNAKKAKKGDRFLPRPSSSI